MLTETDREQFLNEFRLRNRGLIAPDDQRNLSDAVFLIAGCGSTGGAAVEPLVRAGAMHFILVEPGCYELHNLNRQRATVEAMGINKAAWLASQASAINPFVDVEVIEKGISAENAAQLCERATVVIDAVDVTTLDGLAAKCALHAAASAARRVVVCAYDLAYRQLIRVYDYRTTSRPLGGDVERVRRARTPMEALGRLVSPSAIPYEMLEEIKRLRDNPGASISQLGCAADLFGALAVPLVIELLAGRAVRSSYTLDLKDPCLPWSRRARRRVSTLVGLARLQLHAWTHS